MDELIKLSLIAILILGSLLGSFFIASRDKYTNYNMLTPEGKCRWEVAKEICENQDYEFKNVGIWLNSVTAKCVFKNTNGKYTKIKIKLCLDELIKCNIESKKPENRCEEKAKLSCD